MEDSNLCGFQKRRKKYVYLWYAFSDLRPLSVAAHFEVLSPSPWVTKPFHADWRAFIYADSWLMSAGLTGDETLRRKAGGMAPSGGGSSEVPAHQRQRRRLSDTEGPDSGTSLGPDSSPPCAFVDYCLVAPGMTQHARWAADGLTGHTSGRLSTLARRNSTRWKKTKGVSDVCRVHNQGSAHSRGRTLDLSSQLWWW